MYSSSLDSSVTERGGWSAAFHDSRQPFTYKSEAISMEITLRSSARNPNEARIFPKPRNANLIIRGVCTAHETQTAPLPKSDDGSASTRTGPQSNSGATRMRTKANAMGAIIASHIVE